MDNIIVQINESLKRIEKYCLLNTKSMLSIDETSLMIGISKTYLYKLTCKKQIPFYKPNGKKIFFNREEVIEWIQRNRISTEEEKRNKVDDYLVTHQLKKGGII